MQLAEDIKAAPCVIFALAVPPGAAERLRGANTPAERETLLRRLVTPDSAQEGGAG